MLKRNPLVFGGAGDRVTVAVSCPVTGKPIQTTIEVPNNEEFDHVIPFGQPVDEPTAPSDAEFAEWVMSSRTIGLDFGKTMLTTSSGATAVYFAVLNYLGTSELSKSFSGVLAAIPPILFLIAAAVFAAALRPKLAPVGQDEFRTFRDRRLKQLDRLVTTGSVIFGVATALAVCVYLVALDLL